MFVKQLIICNFFSWKLHEKYCPTKMKAYNDSNIGLPRTDWLVLLLFKTLKISINVLLLSNYVQNCFTTLLYTCNCVHCIILWYIIFCILLLKHLLKVWWPLFQLLWLICQFRLHKNKQQWNQEFAKLSKLSMMAKRSKLVS